MEDLERALMLLLHLECIHDHNLWFLSTRTLAAVRRSAGASITFHGTLPDTVAAITYEGFTLEDKTLIPQSEAARWFGHQILRDLPRFVQVFAIAVNVNLMVSNGWRSWCDTAPAVAVDRLLRLDLTVGVDRGVKVTVRTTAPGVLFEWPPAGGWLQAPPLRNIDAAIQALQQIRSRITMDRRDGLSSIWEDLFNEGSEGPSPER